ncbi:hypothetical protein MHC_04085 [Mycoplasma haemocanis str. Illinois]|uniref:Uncharacterized protein n=1 Tax=Mycoplasma haemocanis (strain Illinois) TaxID=1111676 RepID=H6N7Q1_MYCHN|nr:hypothetical protein [Mycoplasma haemocanis]AEW45673.1 hypothetical protein MHC_04085 [Mycoplasma haemocanis str. Illinois]
MVLSTSKFLKIGGPILTGIGGVIATSSLVSRSAEEKPEERIRTKALTDEEPPIKDYKDADEGEGQSDSEGGGSSGVEKSGDQSDQGTEGKPSEEQGKEGTDSSAEGSSQENSEDDEATTESDSDSSGEGTKTEEEGNGMEESSKGGVTDGGSEDAENDHSLGTKYGTIDKRMTIQELENTKQTKDQLVDLLSQISKALEV